MRLKNVLLLAMMACSLALVAGCGSQQDSAATLSDSSTQVAFENVTILKKW